MTLAIVRRISSVPLQEGAKVSHTTLDDAVALDGNAFIQVVE